MIDTDALAGLFVGFIVVVIIAIVIGGVLTVVDVCGSYDLEDITYECTITHMDVDDNRYLVSVVAQDSDFAKTIRVTSSEYATMNVGDKCSVLADGYYYPTQGEVYTYTIIDVSKNDN